MKTYDRKTFLKSSLNKVYKSGLKRDVLYLRKRRVTFTAGGRCISKFSSKRIELRKYEHQPKIKASIMDPKIVTARFWPRFCLAPLEALI